MKASTHQFARMLLAQPEAPVRALTVGRYAILWEGKEGDFMETVSTAEFFDEPTPEGAPTQS